MHRTVAKICEEEVRPRRASSFDKGSDFDVDEKIRSCVEDLGQRGAPDFLVIEAPKLKSGVTTRIVSNAS